MKYDHTITTPKGLAVHIRNGVASDGSTVLENFNLTHKFIIPAAWKSVLDIQCSESENLLGFCHIPQTLPSGTWKSL